MRQKECEPGGKSTELIFSFKIDAITVEFLLQQQAYYENIFSYV